MCVDMQIDNVRFVANRPPASVCAWACVCQGNDSRHAQTARFNSLLSYIGCKTMSLGLCVRARVRRGGILKAGDHPSTHTRPRPVQISNGTTFRTVQCAEGNGADTFTMALLKRFKSVKLVNLNSSGGTAVSCSSTRNQQSVKRSSEPTDMERPPPPPPPPYDRRSGALLHHSTRHCHTREP